MQGIEYKFEELEPLGYPGVMVEGWARVEFDEDGEDIAIEAVFIGDKQNNRQVFYKEDFGKAIFTTLYGPDWHAYLWHALKKYNEE